MRYRVLLMLIVLSLTVVVGCSKAEPSNSNGNEKGITDSDIVIDANDDFFLFNGVIYTNASDIEWVQKADLAIGKKLGNITKQYDEGHLFEENMATKLPVGTEIYEPIKKAGAILIVKVNDKKIRYLGLIEG
jgi:hypothetical protein